VPYRDKLLLLPATQSVADKAFIFQQDNAPAYCARQTVGLLRRETFIAADIWPPNSPDLNPVDYRIWEVVQERVSKRQYSMWQSCDIS